jgi:rubrerythrin
LYPAFAEVAEKEGFSQIAAKFRAVAKVEASHEARYKKLLDNIQTNSVFKSSEETMWQCRECGYIHFAHEAPKVCPSCDHPQAFFQRQEKNF